MIIESKEFILDNDNILFRSPNKDDWESLIKLLKIVYQETRFLAKEASEINISEKAEKAFIERINKSDNSYMVLAFVNGELAGMASIEGGNTIRSAHRANVGIALKQSFTNRHIGTLLFDYLLDNCKYTSLEQLELSVVKKNVHAYHLYLKSGFVCYGVLDRAMKYPDGTYDDEYQMIKKLK